MIDWPTAERLAQLWNSTIKSELPGDSVDVMTILAACTVVATAYTNALSPLEKEKCQKMYLMHLESFFGIPQTGRPC